MDDFSWVDDVDDGYEERRRQRKARIVADRRKSRLIHVALLAGVIIFIKAALDVFGLVQDARVQEALPDSVNISAEEKQETDKKEKEETEVVQAEAEDESAEKGQEAAVASAPVELTPEEKLAMIMEKKDQYTDELIEMAQKNEEARDFLLAYPDLKDTAPAETIGEVKKGEIPLLIQWDDRWGFASYGDSTIAVSGCGPTAMAMVISGLTGDNTITPYKMAKFSVDNGYYAGSVGTSWSLMTDAGTQYGITGQTMPLGKEKMLQEVQAGHPIICSMKPGDFTEVGHFIVLAGVQDGKFRVNDPNSRSKSEKLWSFEELEWQINNIWVFTK